MKKIVFIIFMLVSITPEIACCQSDSSFMNTAISRLKALFNERTEEKVYLHFDKPYYAAGDTMYFKAYLTMGERHEPSAISGILHVDLVSEKNIIVRSIRLQAAKGITWGDFALPDSLPSGNYHVRAYTQWMKNNPDGFFDKIIQVGSLADRRIIYESAYKTKTDTKRAADVQFFPEGGNLVTDVRSKVAFKAIGPDGLGMNVDGVIVDNDHNEVAKIVSEHLGMGVFSFIPESGSSYTAHVTFADGSKKVVALPAVEVKGITLSVNNSVNKVSIEIKANRDYYKENLNKELTLVIYGSGSIRTVKTRLDNEVLGLDLPMSNFKTGILQVTLFSQAGEPLSERLAFIRNPDLLDMEIKGKQVTYHKREQVKLSVSVKSMEKPATGSFSASVIDEGLIPPDENSETTILSYLLLTSGLKGYVEKPNYYFIDTSGNARHHLDILMLTQGFRRFSWKQIIGNNYPAIAYQPEKALEISGKVENLFGNPVKGGTVNLLPSSPGPVLSQTTDASGIFHFSNLFFTDTMSFVLNAANAAGGNSTKISLQRDTYKALIPSYSPPVKQLFSDTMTMTRFLENEKMQHQVLSNKFNSKGILLKEVKIKEIRQDDKYVTQSLAGAGHADQVIHAEDFQFGGKLSDQLNGRLHGVVFYSGVPYLYLTVISAVNAPPPPMMVIVDGVEFPPTVRTDQSVSSSPQTMTGFNIDGVNLTDVETVEVLRNAGASIYGMNGGSGVLVITTKQGSAKNTKDVSSTGILPITVTGFYKAREFYSPKYDAPDLNANHPDLRSTIFWQPDLAADKDGNILLDFFNADGAGTCRVIVEGIDEKGNIGRQVFRYKVE